MIRLAFSFLGLCLLAGAFAAAVIDGTNSIVSDEIILKPLGTTWYEIDPQTLNSAQGAVQSFGYALGGPIVWDYIFFPLLQLPTVLVLFIAGSFFVLVGRRPVKNRIRAI